MISEKFTVVREGLKINGIAHLSDKMGEDIRNNANVEKKPSIIISHGFQCNYAGFDYYGQRFTEYGFNVFCFNFCGGSSKDDFEGKSDGDSRDMSISSEVKDLLTVFEYVKALPYVDTDNIYLMGESQGAFVSGMTAAKLQEQIRKLIMIFPAVCIPDHARRGMLGGSKYDPENPPEEMPLPLTTIGKAFHNDVVKMDAYSELAKYKGETLIIQGTDDDIVVPQYQFILKQVFDASDAEMNNVQAEKKTENRCQLMMVRDMGHMVSETYRESIVDSIELFIEGKRELMNFRIIVTREESLDDNEGEEEHRQDVYFTGYCENDLFTGTITEGVDHQAYIGDRCTKMCAEYTFSGIDADGQFCEMQVVNQRDKDRWTPIIKTASKSLEFLKEANLSAIVEPGKTGPTIRIYK